MIRDTRQNSESSRSHQVVRIHIESRPVQGHADHDGDLGAGISDDSEDMRPVKMSALTFVDLAGSERMNQLDRDESSQRIRQTEGSSINKSLLTLGIVIRALGDQKGHIPFRDSKLTRLLQPSLGGNSRTAIIVTISPASGASDNTQAALFFANAAKRVTMQPRVNEIVRDKALLRHLQMEIASLRKQLASTDFAGEAARLSAALQQREQDLRFTAEQKEAAEKRLAYLETQVLRGSQENLTFQRQLSAGSEAMLLPNRVRGSQALGSRHPSGELTRQQSARQQASRNSLSASLVLSAGFSRQADSPAESSGRSHPVAGSQEERVLGEALQQTEESGIAALEERLARRGESSSLAEAETALTSLLHKLSLKHYADGSFGSSEGGSEANWYPDGEPQPSGKSDSSAMLQGYKSGMNALRDSVVKEVATLKRALDDQAEFAAKLDCQKQLLVQHVLRLEDKALGLSDRAQAAEVAQRLAEKQTIALQTQLNAMDQEVLKARHATALADQRARVAEEARQKLAAAARRTQVPPISTTSTASGGLRSPQSAGTSPALPVTPQGEGPSFRTPGLPGRLNLHRPTPSDSSPDQDSWAAPPSIEILLPKVVALWEELFVPLVHRSRWFLAFRGSEVFYYETEHRRLQHLRTVMGVSSADDGSPESKQSAEKFLEKAQRKLEWERRFLASQLKVEYTAEERDELFLKWNIYKDSKERKLQLVRQLWAANRQNPEDMQEFSEMVLRLNGTEVSDGYDLVFAKSDGDSWMKSMLASSGRVMGPVLHRVVTAPQALKPASGSMTPSRSDSLRPGERPRSFLSSIRNLTPVRRNPSATSTTSGGWNPDPGTPQSATPKKGIFGSFTKQAGRKVQER
ncbi:hypothetical protein WJX84_002496 [Apatococcus fuscideae]|uniref:Kinesin motor domain-containing protein n=1 Tax=Apatococcus fuscideae TaxID=2026836 RepID=A0AAW1SMK9_9CHLO